MSTGTRRFLLFAGIAAVLALMYALRGVLLPLFFAFVVAYLLDPLVDRLERWRVPRGVGAPLVMLAMVALVLTAIFVGVPFLADELRAASQHIPERLSSLYTRAEGWLSARYHYRLPETWAELFAKYGADVRRQLPEAGKIGGAIFGTMGAIFVVLSGLIIPIFALYLLGDFDRIIKHAARLVPRRWAPAVGQVMTEIHVTLGRYVRGQLLTNLVLSVLYATGLSLTGVRFAVPIGVLTGMLAFVPYVGLILGTSLAAMMALLEWQGGGQLLGVVAVMAIIGTLDGMVITPRIVGGSVGLKPIEVLVTLMAAGTLFGFVGVLLAVPLGAVLKILISRAVRAYLGSSFYQRAPGVDTQAGPG